MNTVATQPHNLPLLATPEDCTGGTYIVTGGNSGLGFEAAKHLVLLGAARVILGVRNTSAGETAKKELESASGKLNVVEVWEVDLAKYDSVKAFAKKAVADLDRIDALIENAGVSGMQPQAEGHNMCVTVNVLSTLLLAVLLLPKMVSSANRFGNLPHLTVVTSTRSLDIEKEWMGIKDDPLVKIETEETITLYPLTKLFEILAIRQLSRLLPVAKTGVVLNLACPGFCKTNLTRNAPKEFRERLVAMHAKYGRTPEDGSRNLVYGAVAGTQSHGYLISDCKIVGDEIADWVADEEGQASQRHLWEKIADELESIEPGCVKMALDVKN